MSLVKTSVLNGVAVTVRMGVGLILNKILAVLVGPSGYAVIGQFQNIIQMAAVVATGSINNGVTKYTAQYQGDDDRQRRLWGTSGTLVLGFSLAMSAFIILFREPLARSLLQDDTYAGVFVWLGAGLTLLSLNVLLAAILNGRKELRRFFLSNIVGSLVMLVTMALLTYAWGLYGALVALSIYQSLICFVTLAICWRAPWFRLRHLIGPVDWKQARALSVFALMAVGSATSNAVGAIVVRHNLGEQFGWDLAGIWDGMGRISTMNLGLVAGAMSFYFLPRIAELEDWKMIRHEIWTGMRLIVPVFMGIGVMLYLLRDLVIRVLFTAEFAAMEQLFAWALAGDVARVSTWFLAYVMIAKSMTAKYLATEVLSNVLFVGCALIAVNMVGFRGVAIAYFVAYTAMWPVMYYFAFGGRRPAPNRDPASAAA